jgi:hypothetical protein
VCGVESAGSENIAGTLHLDFQIRQIRTAREVPPRQKLPSCGKQLEKNSAQMSDREELAAAMGTPVVMHGNLDDVAAPVLQFPHHLYADHAAIASELDLLEKAPAEEPEIAVDVPDLQAEQKAHEALIDDTNDNSVSGVRPVDLVPIDNVDAHPEGIQQQRQFFDIILPIPVGIENQILGAI